MKKVIVAGICMAMGVAAYADIANLGASNDAAVWYRSGTSYMDELTGSDVDMDVYSYTDLIGAYNYVQFDLSSLGNITINSATLTMTKAASNPQQTAGQGGHSDNTDTIVDGRIAFYGLTTAAGNTPQNWDESTFNFNATGSEIDAASALGTDPFNVGSGRAVDFNTLETSADPSVTLSGAAVTSFLQGRADDNGLVTFMIDEEANDLGKGWAFNSSEAASGAPVLTVDYTVIPEPATLGLVGIFGVGVLFIRRRLAI